MITIFNILTNTKSTFDYLDNQYEDDLDANTTIIFIVFGLVIATETFFKDRISYLGLKWIILTFLLGAGAGLIFGKFIISYLIFWIGKILKGKSEIIDIKVVVAYSLIPRIIQLPIILYLGFTGKYGQITGFEYYLINVIYIGLSLLTIKILLQGLVRFNNFGYLKAILNVSPFILLGLFIYSIVLFK
jgi:hypothetical protein